MTNRSKTLYTGVTGNPETRVFEHKQGVKGEFAARYKIDRLAYFERFGDLHSAIGGWPRLVHINSAGGFIPPRSPARWHQLMTETRFQEFSRRYDGYGFVLM